MLTPECAAGCSPSIHAQYEVTNELFRDRGPSLLSRQSPVAHLPSSCVSDTTENEVSDEQALMAHLVLAVGRANEGPLCNFLATVKRDIGRLLFRCICFAISPTFYRLTL